MRVLGAGGLATMVLAFFRRKPRDENEVGLERECQRRDMTTLLRLEMGYFEVCISLGRVT